MKNLSFDEVTLLDGMFMDAKKADVEFIKKLDPERLLSGFRKNAGLGDGEADPYGGWENSRIGGHTMGHYLVALAQYVKKSKDEEMMKRLKYIVAELKKCQAAHGNGFLFGAKLEEGERPEDQFDHEEGKKEAAAWVPWYTMHKIIAGLLACYKLCGLDEALEAAQELGDWVYARVTGWDAATHDRILHTEYGGMSDCLYELSVISGQHKYAEAAIKFDDLNLLNELSSDKKDALNGQHANSTIPKYLGVMNRYPLPAEHFWEKVTTKHAYITGGISDMEHFREDDSLDCHRTQCNCEGCCNYNMLKLSSRLYNYSKDVKYQEYMERVLFNGILGGINTDNGTTAYFTPMATGYEKTFCEADPERNMFWCCTGTGMENYTKIEEQIYAEDNNELFVNQYISSEAVLNELHFSQKVSYEDKMTVMFTYDSKNTSTIHFRIPAWCEEEPALEENHVLNVRRDAKYLVVTVRGCGEASISFPMKRQRHHLPDNHSAVCFTYGPFVLAAKLGRERHGEKANAGIDVVASGVKIVGNQSAEPEIVYGETHTQILDNEKMNFLEDNMCELVPFYQIKDERYGIYWYE